MTLRAEVAAALSRLADKLGQGHVQTTESFIAMLEARHVRLTLWDGNRVVLSVASNADAAGISQVLVRASAAELPARLRDASLTERGAHLVHELMRSERWTEGMLLARHHAKFVPVPDAETIAARRSAVRAAFDSFPGPRGWQSTLSPALPSLWPLSGGARLVTYAAATRPSPSSPTLFEYSLPYAAVEHDPAGEHPLRAQPLCEGVVSGGFAALVPLSAELLQEVRALPELERLYACIALGEPDEAVGPQLRHHMRFFRQRAGWFAEALRSRHAEFMAWLDAR